MPRMGMFIENARAPTIVYGAAASTNNMRVVQSQKVNGLANMSFKAPLVDRIAGLKPGCSACGK